MDGSSIARLLRVLLLLVSSVAASHAWSANFPLWGTSTRAAHSKLANSKFRMVVERVEFEVEQSRVVGELHLPGGSDGGISPSSPVPAVIVGVQPCKQALRILVELV